MQRVMAKLACISKAFKGHSSTLSAPLAAAGPVYLRPCTRYTLISRTATSLRTLSNADLPQQLCSTSSSGHSVRCQSSQNPQQIQQASQSTTDSLTGPPQAYCSGCGVKFQQDDPDLPGYFRAPKQKELVQKDAVLTEEDEAILRASSESTTFRTAADLIEGADKTSTSGRGMEAVKPAEQRQQSMADRSNDDFWQDQGQGDFATEVAFEGDEENDESVLLCARCYSLQHYGKVKSQAAEAALPAFDLGKKVGQKIALQKFRTPIVLCVVDIADFDGSLPRQALLSFLPKSMYSGFKRDSASENGHSADARQGGMQSCKLIVACNKADLLPKQASLSRIQAWVKKRVADAGLPTPSSIHMISSLKQLGVKDLLSELQSSAGPAGDVWVVGAQNAGKSSLINAMRRVVGKKSTKRDVTTAALPGTTLGMLRIDGIMTGRNRMFDTPGVPHSHQLSARLTPDEVKLLLSRGRLVPRTFRASAGQTVFIGGLARIDVTQITKATMYLTVWASSDLKCHYGKTEGAEERYEKMAGSTLVPPIGNNSRVEQLGPLLPSLLRVEGRDWKGSSTDVAIAGLGWVGIGLSGVAELKIWVHKGVAVTRRQALIPDYSAEMQRPGLTDKALKAPKAAKKR